MSNVDEKKLDREKKRTGFIVFNVPMYPRVLSTSCAVYCFSFLLCVLLYCDTLKNTKATTGVGEGRIPGKIV